jgi:hypothetical protein
MYIIHEENHSCLCVTEEISKGVFWLIANDWLTADSVGITEDDKEFTLGDVVPGAREKKNLIFFHFVKIYRKDGMKGALEWLESFGFYFNEIEVT